MKATIEETTVKLDYTEVLYLVGKVKRDIKELEEIRQNVYILNGLSTAGINAEIFLLNRFLSKLTSGVEE